MNALFTGVVVDNGCFSMWFVDSVKPKSTSNMVYDFASEEWCISAESLCSSAVPKPNRNALQMRF